MAIKERGATQLRSHVLIPELSQNCFGSNRKKNGKGLMANFFFFSFPLMTNFFFSPKKESSNEAINKLAGQPTTEYVIMQMT